MENTLTFSGKTVESLVIGELASFVGGIFTSLLSSVDTEAWSEVTADLRFWSSSSLRFIEISPHETSTSLTTIPYSLLQEHRGPQIVIWKLIIQIQTMTKQILHDSNRQTQDPSKQAIFKGRVSKLASCMRIISSLHDQQFSPKRKDNWVGQPNTNGQLTHRRQKPGQAHIGQPCQWHRLHKVRRTYLGHEVSWPGKIRGKVKWTTSNQLGSKQIKKVKKIMKLVFLYQVPAKTCLLIPATQPRSTYSNSPKQLDMLKQL